MDDGKTFEWLDEDNCCLEFKKLKKFWLTMSHYHCPRCGAATGSYGHSGTMCKFLPGSWKEAQTTFHRCCPDFCELGNHISAARVEDHKGLQGAAH